MQFAEISSGGSFFKPEEYTRYAALLLEVTGFERNRPTNYGPKDTAHVDITAFDAEGNQVADAQGVMIQQTILARDLAPIEGKATIQYLTKGTSSKPGQNAPWVWRTPEDSVKGKVMEWAKARVEAEKEALADAPSF